MPKRKQVQQLFEETKEGNSSLATYSRCAIAARTVDAESLHGSRKQLGKCLWGGGLHPVLREYSGEDIHYMHPLI